MGASAALQGTTVASRMRHRARAAPVQAPRASSPLRESSVGHRMKAGCRPHLSKLCLAGTVRARDGARRKHVEPEALNHAQTIELRLRWLSQFCVDQELPSGRRAASSRTDLTRAHDANTS